MPNVVEIENIEDLRRQRGIDDVELRKEIRGLRSGHFVRLTLLANAAACETLLIRITSIKGPTFRGKLARRPSSMGLKKLPLGAAVVFTAAHIHSIPKNQPNRQAGAYGRTNSKSP